MLLPEPREVSRRGLFKWSVGIGAASAASAVAGYGIATIDGRGADNRAEAQATPSPTPKPEPAGPVASARDATLPPVQPSPLNLTYRAKDATVEIAGGVMYNAWTFEDTVPGPVLHVKQGDVINFTLVNDASIGHSIDFHAAQTPWDKNYITIVPGDSLSFDWRADFPGVFVYHCGTAPVLHHMANGMYGLIVVDPAPQLEPAREYWLLQSEFYAKPGENGTWDGSLEKMLVPAPDVVAFNGAAFQYRDFPLAASAGEKIRLYVGNIGPTLFSAFHVIGALFDVVYVDGNPRNPLYGLQTYTIPPGGGVTCELTIPEPGQYPFVTHSFAYTGLGAVGLLEVT